MLVDLPAFGRPVRLRWRKRRWTCPNTDCAIRSFIEQDPTIGPQRALLTSRAARWVTVGVGGRGRSVDEVAAELGCGWHTVNNEVVRWGEALLGADTDRIGEVGAVGIDKKRCSGGKAGGEPRFGALLSSTWGATSRFDIVGGRTADSAAAVVPIPAPRVARRDPLGGVGSCPVLIGRRITGCYRTLCR